MDNIAIPVRMYRSVSNRFTSLNPGFCGSCCDKFTWEGITQPKTGRFSSMEIRDIVRRGGKGCPFCKLIADSIPTYMAKYAKDAGNQLVLKQGIKLSFHMKAEQGSLDTIIVKMKDELPGSAWQDAFELKVFASENDPTATFFPLRPLEQDASAQSIVSRARISLSECKNNHIECRLPGASRLPTRVIDVATRSFGEVRLYCTARNGQLGEYVALSYCWGGDQPVKTTKSNLESHKRGIEINSLPQTLVDAVKTTRALGFKYLWIDALCIIQDDLDDKSREIGKMAEVYGESTITISAAKANAVSDGFLQYEHPSLTIRVKVPGGEKGQFSVTPHFQPSFSSLPLNTRGWALQESILPPRLLVYAKHEVAWRCRTIDCQPVKTSWIDYSEHEAVPPRGPGKPHTSEFDRGLWHKLVHDYTTRKLTVLDDRVEAINGVIKILSEAWDDQCLFGLWKSEFVRQLMWSGYFKYDKQRRIPRLTRPPSWSWMSVAYTIRTWTCDGQGNNILSSFNHIDAELLPYSFSSAKETGKVFLHCKFRQRKEMNKEDDCIRPGHKKSGWIVKRDLDGVYWPYTLERAFHLFLGTVSLKVSGTSTPTTIGLGLMVIQTEKDIFQRAGIVETTTTDDGVKCLEYWKRVPSRLIALV